MVVFLDRLRRGARVTCLVSIKRRLRQNGMLIKILKYHKINMYYCIQDIYYIYIYNISMPIQYTMEK